MGGWGERKAWEGGGPFNGGGVGHGRNKYDISQLFVHLSQMMERSKMGGGFVCGGRRQASLKLDSTTSRKVADFFLAALSGPFPWLGSRREFNAHESVSVFFNENQGRVDR